jgi:hypothetical protein
MRTRYRVILLSFILGGMLPVAEGRSPRKVSLNEAVRLAEQFIVWNGYTDLPPTKNLPELTPEAFDRSDDRKEWLKQRYNTLERKAFAYAKHGRGEPGWTIVFRFKGPPKSPYGRAVSMNLYGSELSVVHQDAILNGFTPLNKRANSPRSPKPIPRIVRRQGG